MGRSDEAIEALARAREGRLTDEILTPGEYRALQDFEQRSKK
jgi:hypothetical protein